MKKIALSLTLALLFTGTAQATVRIVEDAGVHVLGEVTMQDSAVYSSAVNILTDTVQIDGIEGVMDLVTAADGMLENVSVSGSVDLVPEEVEAAVSGVEIVGPSVD